MAIFPLAPDQTIAQMWSNGVQWSSNLHVVSSQATEAIINPVLTPMLFATRLDLPFQSTASLHLDHYHISVNLVATVPSYLSHVVKY